MNILTIDELLELQEKDEVEFVSENLKAILMHCQLMGWNHFATHEPNKSTEEVQGIIVGTADYVDHFNGQEKIN